MALDVKLSKISFFAELRERMTERSEAWSVKLIILFVPSEYLALRTSPHCHFCLSLACVFNWVPPPQLLFFSSKKVVMRCEHLECISVSNM